MTSKTFNTESSETLNPMDDVRNYAAGTEDKIAAGPKTKGEEDEDDDLEPDDDANDDDYSEDEPLPGEIANPEDLDAEQVS